MHLTYKRLRLLFTFYSSFLPASVTISICGAIVLALIGIKILPAVFWFKVINTGIIVYYINKYKGKEFYYYQNAGLSKRFLYTWTLAFDFLLFIIMAAVILTLHLKLNPI